MINIWRVLALASLVALLIPACASYPTVAVETPAYIFALRGGFFYGPGPIEPDTALPDGRISGVRFDVNRFRGYAEFRNDGTRQALLSDGRTRINQNIEAGLLNVGGGTSPVVLAAVDGGPHRGTELYYLDEDFRFVWRVDLALDPGFEEGIIRMDDFVLHTGVVRIAPSLQTANGLPGGYNRAGSMQTGRYLVGRAGDFDQDGYMDGVLVAAPNVPLSADMLPGAPVGNRRGFSTTIPLEPQVSAELTLRSLLHLKAPLLETTERLDINELRTLGREVSDHLAAADGNLRRIRPPQEGGTSDPAAAHIARRVSHLAEVHKRDPLPAFGGSSPTAVSRGQLIASVESLFHEVESVIEVLAARNDHGGRSLRRAAVEHGTGVTAGADRRL